MTRLPIKCCLLAVAVSFPAGTALAGGFNNPDMGPRRNGMFAVTGMPDDTTAIMHNQAGLADQRGNRVYMSGMAAFLNLEAELKCEDWMDRWDYELQCYEREYTRTLRPERTFGVSPFLGVSIDLDPWVENLVVGGAVYAPNFMGAFMDQSGLGRFHAIESLFVTVLGTGAVGYRPNRYVSVGAGVSFMYVLFEQWKRYDSEGLVGFDLGSEIDMKLDGVDRTSQFHLGLLISPTPWLNIGLGFDSQTWLDVQGQVKFALVDEETYDQQPEQYHVVRHETQMVVPYKLKTGINVRPTSWLEIGMDYFFWRYSVFQEQVTELYATEESEGLAMQLAGQTLVSPRHMKDAHNLCMGARFAVPRSPFPLFLMTGAQYDWSPGNDDYFSLDSPYSDIYGVSLGFDSEPLPWLRVGFAWIHNRFSDIDVTASQSSPPTNLRARIYNNQLQLALQAIF